MAPLTKPKEKKGMPGYHSAGFEFWLSIETKSLLSLASNPLQLPRWSHPAAHQTFPFPFATPAVSLFSRQGHGHSRSRPQFSSFLTMPFSAASSMFLFSNHIPDCQFGSPTLFNTMPCLTEETLLQLESQNLNIFLTAGTRLMG